MHVVATAGHVDHGKSTLVRALTGQDPDRLAEERRRGLSIELGYCWTDLAGVGEVAFVDVPGHQRFVTTALAGVGPAPVAMLVVAADDPWMPQAAEHLAALDALGVEHGVLVVTRADLADAGPALARAREEVARTSLRGMPDVVVSGRTGEGLDRLGAALASVLAEVPSPDPAADVRLWVDRRFHVRGTGTVVTGTLAAGTISVGDELEGPGVRVRVRGLESLGRPVESVRGVARVALALGGGVPEAVTRGTTLVTPAAYVATGLVDVELTRVGARELPGQPVLHVGSAMVGVRLRPLGDGRHARLALARPLPLRIGDRALLRDPGDRSVWGVRVLDPVPPALARRGAAARRAATLTGLDGGDASEIAARGFVRRSVLRRIGSTPVPLPAGTVEAGDWLVDADLVAQLRGRLVTAAREAGPEGLTPAAAAHELGLPDPALVDALAQGPLVAADGRIRHPGAAALDPEVEAMAAEVVAGLAERPFAAPDADRLRELGLDSRRQALLHREGRLLRVADGIVLAPGADDVAVSRLAELDQPFTTSAARQALDTSRRVVLPLLAHLDATGRTLRLPDDRRRLR